MVCLNTWTDAGKSTKVYRGHGIFKSFFSTPNQIICNRPSAGLSQPWLVELTFWKLASGEQGAGSPVSGSKEMLALNFRLNQCYSQPGFEAKSFTQLGLVTQRGGSQTASDAHLSRESCLLCVLKDHKPIALSSEHSRFRGFAFFLEGFWFASLKIIMYFYVCRCSLGGKK